MGLKIAALASGILLGFCILANGLLAKATSPVFSSWFAHGVGVFASLFVWPIFFRGQKIFRISAPWWAYLPGVPGAFAVILMNFCINSWLGFSGTLSLVLLGQILLGVMVDRLGWFETRKRKIVWIDYVQICLVFTGAIILLKWV